MAFARRHWPIWKLKNKQLLKSNQSLLFVSDLTNRSFGSRPKYFSSRFGKPLRFLTCLWLSLNSCVGEQRWSTVHANRWRTERLVFIDVWTSRLELPHQRFKRKRIYIQTPALRWTANMEFWDGFRCSTNDLLSPGWLTSCFYRNWTFRR